METKPGARWWESSVGYIIYPESFKDSNGDGIGDIPGIISRLDYLKDLGVNLLWICPLFKSPMDDNGYDVSDYYQINPRYGTMEDLERLLASAHSLGIRVILDFPLNHTSSMHPWFQMALKDPESEERGYYFFKKGKVVDGKLLPPNNWKGFFSTSAWKNVEGSDDFYLHIFSEKMPDVNWNNPLLREKFYEIARFYLDKGADGFRLDAVAHLAKDTSFADSSLPKEKDGLVYDTDKFSNRPEVFDYLRMFKDNVFSHYDCLTIGEAGGCISPEDSLKMSDRINGSINMVFNFDTVWNNGNYNSIGKKDDEIVTDVLSLKRNFMRWYDVCHDKADMPIYWCNHDHPRVVSQYGSVKYRNESSKMLLTTMLFLYGTPFIYNGDEIGMSNVTYPNVEDFFSDVGTKNDVVSLRKLGYDDETILTYLRRTSRVNARTPMQWNRSTNAGFSDGKSVNPVNDNYLSGVNVQEEMEDPYSIINFFQYAISIRKDPLINDQVLNGKLSIVDPDHPDVFSYIHDGSSKLMVISNFRDKDVYFTFYYEIGDLLLHNYDGVQIENHIIKLRPYESFLIKLR
jgi:oligo-1,6-glucosidase